VQVQDLTARGFLPELNPHSEHSRLEGNQRLTPATVRWQRSAFSFQQPHQHRPAGIGHRLAQPGPGQTGHGQVLHVDPLVIAGDAVGQLVMGDQGVSRTLRCWTATRPAALARRFDPFVFLASDLCGLANALAFRRR
jgi:hypothetical protein